MDYFRPCLINDDGIVAAWDSQAGLIADAPELVEIFESRRSELFPRFAAAYSKLRALPRGARRRLLSRLADCHASMTISAELRQKLTHTIAGAALLLALAQGAEAATIKVTTNIPDINDGDGKCSLVEAIVNANDGAATHPDCGGGDVGGNTIILPAKKTITLTTVDNGAYGSNGLPGITSQVTIEGNGSRIIRQPTASAFRLMAVANSGDLTLKNVILSGGFSLNEGGADYSGYGGAIFNNGNLTVVNSTVSVNAAIGSRYGGTGGGISNYGTATITNSTISENTAVAYPTYYATGGGLSNAGTLTVIGSTISSNIVVGAFYAEGGGVWNYSGTLVIENSAITSNIAYGGSAGAASDGGGVSTGGPTAIVNSTISGNTAANGGGIFTIGTATISNSVVSKNIAHSGGGISNFYLLAIEKSIIKSNVARDPKVGFGGGVWNSSDSTLTITNASISGNISDADSATGGGVENDYGTVTIANSTISNNIVHSGASMALGGGIYNTGTFTILNSTISSNSVASDSSTSLAGGIYNYSGRLVVAHSTVAGNVAADGAGGLYNGGPGPYYGDASIHHSLISGNSPVGYEMANYGLLVSDYNLFGNKGNAGVYGFTPSPTDIVPSAPLNKIIGPLKNNGGPTKTHALVKGGPAIDAAPADAECPATDQRGVARPRGLGCDIGAFER